VVWESLLSKVFREGFQDLLCKEAKNIDTTIGSAARVFQGLALGESDDELVRDPLQIRLNPATYGLGLVTTITNWMPELRRSQRRMEDSSKYSLAEAAPIYSDQTKRFGENCGCHVCISRDTATFPHYTTSSQSRFCQAAMIEKIVALGLALSRMKVSPELYPMAAGVRGFYASQVKKRLEAQRYSPISIQRFVTMYGDEWNVSDPKGLQNCVEMFTGSKTQA
jgi:hypothetical protein